MRPIDNVGSAVSGDNNVRGTKVAMADLVVLGHTLKSCVQLVSCGCVKLTLRDFAVHLVLKLCKKGTLSFVDIHLNIYEHFDVFFLACGVILHHLGKGLALDKFGNDSPLAVYCGNLKDLGDIKSGFLDARLIQRLVKNVSLGVLLAEHLDASVTVAVNRLFCSCCNYIIKLHFLSPSLRICAVRLIFLGKMSTIVGI